MKTKRVTKTEVVALSMAVMCCERFPELYTADYINDLKIKYADKLKSYKEKK